MLNRILKWSITQRWLVVIGAIIVTVWGFQTVSQMPLDVFPNFAPPQVEIQTEAPGLAPEEVESLVTLPIESSMNGISGVETVRSSSGVGISVVRIIFKWDTDIYQARQLVTERLQQATSQLPESVNNPQISPLSSPIGTILQYAFTVEEGGNTTLMDLRKFIDFQLNNQVLAVSGVTQVVVYGGDVKQYQVLVDPKKLQAFDVTLSQVTEAAALANTNAPGGFLIKPDREFLIRGIGRVESLQDIKEAVVSAKDGIPILLQDVASIEIGAALKRGDASIDGKKAIVIQINKQPFADTPTVTEAVEKVMGEIQKTLPPDVKVTLTFRQADFIDAAINNVSIALRDGIIIVSIILFLFLLNWRTAVITLSAIPLSLLIGLMLMNWFGLGINTMMLGGLAVAIGSVVDDSIVDMENCYRGLRKNQQASNPLHPWQVVYQTSVEVRLSVLFSTVIIGVVFAPIFTLTGVEGRIFAPMGIAYLASIFASTFVALTLSPALCALLLANSNLPEEETWLTKLTQRLYSPLLRFSIHFPSLILMVAVALMVASFIILPSLGRVFLPEFQETSLVNAINLYPGASLEMTNRAGFTIQEALIADPRYKAVQLRSGRAAGDTDAGSVTLGHLDIELTEEGIRNREESIQNLRNEFAKLPGVAANIGGFITHRMDEVLSGVRSAIAIKIYGENLHELRKIGQEVRDIMKDVPGVVDLFLEPQVPIRQIQIDFNRIEAARYGLRIVDISQFIKTALNGRVVSQVLEEQQLFNLLVWLEEDNRNDVDKIANLLIDTPVGTKIPLAQVASINYGTGPNTINRENVSRLIVVSANVSDRDLGSVVAEIQAKVNESISLPTGYFIQYGGQFESEERARTNLLLFGTLAIIAITILMYLAVKSISATIIIMLNLPLALTGGIFAVTLGGGILSIASMVGFITLFGVATRNGLLLVDNYNQKLTQGIPLKQVIIQGSQERLIAILMTAFTSALGMLPLVVNTEAGKEILQPLAIVVLGGLFTSTALTLLVLPALYARFGKFLIPKNYFDGKIETQNNQKNQSKLITPK